MSAYAYPIKIDRTRQTIRFDEVKEFENGFLTLQKLQFVGGDEFSISDRICETGIGEWPAGYIVTVKRSRIETDDEMATRLAGAESYMEEYNKRHLKK